MFCSQCGSDNKVDAKYCTKCGIDLTKQTPPDRTIAGDSLGDAGTSVGQDNNIDKLVINHGMAK